MNDVSTFVAADDHRVRVGREKRDRTQRRLLEAVLAKFTDRHGDGMPLVDDVIREASVSRATFYKYFTSVDQAVAMLGQQLETEMILSYQAMFNGSESAFFVMTTSIQLFLFRAVIDPVWASFVSRAVYLNHEQQEPLVGLTAHLAGARVSGEVDFVDTAAAASIGFGSIMDAMGRIARTGGASRAYIEDLVAMILRAWGLDDAAARNVVRDRTIFIRGLAPDRIVWWKDPWRS